MKANATPAPNSAPNSTAADTSARQKEWRGEIHTPEAEYNANVPVSDIERDPANRVPTDEDVAARAESIKTVGLLQPIVLRDLGGGKYRLMAGETRWRAFKLLKRPTIAARIYKGQSEVQASEKSLVENAQRADLKPIERAKRFKDLADHGKTQKEIGALAGGLSQPVVANAIRLLELPVDVQELVDGGELTEAHGVALVRFARWKAVCSFIAKKAAAHGTGAKQLQSDKLPYADELVTAGLALNIPTERPSYYTNNGPAYKIPEALKKDPAFIEGHWYNYYYILPEDSKDNVWTAERGRQDNERQEREEAAAKKAAEAAKKNGGKKTKEQKDRAEKIEKNKASREAIAGTLARAVLRLKSVKVIDIPSLIVIADRAASNAGDIEEAVGMLGLKLPKGCESTLFGYNGDLQALNKLPPADLVKLVATMVMLGESAEAHRYAGEVPDSSDFIAGAGAHSKGKTAATVQVTVRLKASDNFAKAGEAKASSTSGPEAAARAAAAKALSCKEEQVDLLCTREGSSTDGTTALYTTVRKGGK